MNRLRAFFRGMREFRLSLTWADPARTADNPFTELDNAYNWGREWAHRLTLRRYEA